MAVLIQRPGCMAAEDGLLSAITYSSSHVLQPLFSPILSRRPGLWKRPLIPSLGMLACPSSLAINSLDFLILIILTLFFLCV